MSVGVILTSYFEQIHTTFETMRRRGLAIYDCSAEYAVKTERMYNNVSKKLTLLLSSESLKSVVLDICDQSPLDSDDKAKRNALQEFYFGISILIIAMCAGEMTGVLWSTSVLSKIFNPYVEFALVFFLPIYAYLHIKHKNVLDAIERRSWLFGLVFIMCIYLGDLVGNRLILTNPSLFFLVPFFFALTIDVEFSPNSLYSNRLCLLAVTLMGSFLVMQSIAIFSGMKSLASSGAFILQCFITAVHFQVMEPRINSNEISKNEAQLVYIFALILIQLPLAFLFSSFN